MNAVLLDHIVALIGVPILQHRVLSGGDISEVNLIRTDKSAYVLKTHEGLAGSNLLMAEKDGLEAIALTRAIRTPEVHHFGEVDGIRFLLMDYVAPKTPESSDFQSLGRHLAALHQKSHDSFGWVADNFIGTLPQQNGWQSQWHDFYLQNRLLPQFRMAFDAELLTAMPSEERMHSALTQTLPVVVPALLHGDFWSGNYLISKTGVPFLIDPAVCYGHYEMDLAMARLFGGFHDQFFDAYAEIIARTPGEVERIEIYQLYYLLVHLNLFGMGYLPAVTCILRRYFS